MPLVKRCLADMIQLSAICDVMVNPVNIVGTMGAGLAKAFADRWPEMCAEYKTMCQDENGEKGKGSLQIGKLHLYHDKESKNVIVNLPTKRDWRDPSDLADVEIGCIKLAEYLKQHPLYTVAMPILGTGYGLLDVDLVYPLIAKHLDGLPNVIHLCMRPDRFKTLPLYLGIVGSRAYNDYDKIDLGVSDGLIEFGMGYNDFEAAVSGGADGVDRVACGTGERGDNRPNVATMHGMRTIVCKADWERYGNSAGFLRNRTIADILTHVVAFVGEKSVGTRGLLDLVNRYNADIDKQLAVIATQPPADMFASSATPTPLIKKQIFICDISKVSP